MIRSQILMRREQLRDGKTKVVVCLIVMKPGSTAHECTIKTNERGWFNEASKENENTETTT
jgi:hypothetical protein